MTDPRTALLPEAPNTANILLGGEDVMDEDEAVPLAPVTLAAGSDRLISQIIVPSPYPHHSTGATSARFRNALSRVSTDPLTDVEAWQALMTEASACYRAILPNMHSVDADTHAKLDWIESCFGALLKHFPYASAYHVTVAELMMMQSARVGEENGPYMDYGGGQRAARCEAKLERILKETLGIELDGTLTEGNKLGGMCTSSIDLWQLYIKKRVRDANRQPIPQQEDKLKLVREWTVKAYDVAVRHASFVVNNHILWKQYLEYVKGWIPNPATNVDHALGQQQMAQLRSVYQRLVTHPMTDLPQLWQEYEAFERGHSEALAQALIPDLLPKFQHARNVYMERNRVYSAADLQMNRLATAPVDDKDEDYASKMVEENRLLTLWKKRCSYERTNPERLPTDELAVRVRQTYKELICCFTLYPEVWHMWSTWELLQGTTNQSDRIEFAVEALKLAQQHIPDCTLLAYSEAQILERQSRAPKEAMSAMEAFLERSPNTVAFVLYQQMARRYKGVDAARAVFARARRQLKEPLAEGNSATKDDSGDDTKEGDSGAAIDAGGGTGTSAPGDSGTTETAGAIKTETATNGQRHTVTNRWDIAADTSQKWTVPKKHKQEMENDNHMPPTRSRAPLTMSQVSESLHDFSTGRITWQLYACHANMEHRQNLAPRIAAKVYELGLRKHVSFLTKVPYVIRYAQLLMELQDRDNLKALLTRALAACESDNTRPETTAALWNITLQFEDMLSGTDPANLATLDAVEQRRHAALVGPDVEDVATGGPANSDDQVTIGLQKTPLGDQLIRAEGYDVSSQIVSGLSRMMDAMGVVGLWGSDALPPLRPTSFATLEKSELEAGGKSDASYQRRLHFQKVTAAGQSVDTALHGGSTRGTSARDRLQQGGPGATSAMALAIQQSPEWLRPMLLVLPASRNRAAMLGKAPPHMIEMALSALRNNALPPQPMDGTLGGLKRKHSQGAGGGDSSDEENGGIGGSGGGYGNQFRARQRSRLMASNTTSAAGVLPNGA